MAALTGKAALVTGASRGIGRGIAQRLAADGALVAVHYGRDEGAAKETVAAIEAAGGQAFAVRAELGVPGDADTLVEAVVTGLQERTGTDRLDILVNNAAVDEGGDGETPEAFDRLFAVNVRAPYFLIRRALQLMGEGGRIINIGSGVTRISVPGELAYSMSKAALATLGRNLANEVGPRGITINTVEPGTVHTDRTAWLFSHPQAQQMVTDSQAIERVGVPADIAGVVAFLASPDSGFVTANTIDASGGTYLGPKNLG
ncbi:SDR family NAD(P)-dependent oxidoreductase [Streptomyces sp. TLI_185]|uniref:SDR family NAD(P)-dependent oxidoreductase n=1 Tax=Streptomyces sp. TLI_185 TaxID=2485151 RepID=UPI000F4E569F|nr:SDR family oxidoreductase [Streptomyces sp. TLI_185]RPF37966.1 NAD(P)-dependent dehydrogenase (short-subunit alcohol dehydrogenase family) [Streptomyces sp. TLI_185]